MGNLPRNPIQIIEMLRNKKPFDMYNSMLSGTWQIIYKDGTIVNQIKPDGSEVPFKHIEWSEVDKLVLESQFVKQTFKISSPGDGFKIALRSRHWLTTLGKKAMCFILIAWNAEDEKPNDQNIKWSLYWLPNGIVHHCDLFNCRDIDKYYMNAMSSKEYDKSVKFGHGHLVVDGDADLNVE